MMKKMGLIIGISVICALTYGCGTQQNEDKIHLDKMNAQEILEVLNNQGYPNDAATIYTDKGSTNGYPWSIQGCTSAVNWSITTGPEGQESVGIIEVFDFAINCNRRKNSAESLSSFFSPDQHYFVQEGVVFLQIPNALKINEAAQFEAALKAMAEGKLPEPYNSK